MKKFLINLIYITIFILVFEYIEVDLIDLEGVDELYPLVSFIIKLGLLSGVLEVFFYFLNRLTSSIYFSENSIIFSVDKNDNGCYNVKVSRSFMPSDLTTTEGILSPMLILIVCFLSLFSLTLAVIIVDIFGFAFSRKHEHITEYNIVTESEILKIESVISNKKSLREYLLRYSMRESFEFREFKYKKWNHNYIEN